jgi:hypothetical protein
VREQFVAASLLARLSTAGGAHKRNTTMVFRYTFCCGRESLRSTSRPTRFSSHPPPKPGKSPREPPCCVNSTCQRPHRRSTVIRCGSLTRARVIESGEAHAPAVCARRAMSAQHDPRAPGRQRRGASHARLCGAPPHVQLRPSQWLNLYVAVVRPQRRCSIATGTGGGREGQLCCQESAVPRGPPVAHRSSSHWLLPCPSGGPRLA